LNPSCKSVLRAKNAVAGGSDVSAAGEVLFMAVQLPRQTQHSSQDSLADNLPAQAFALLAELVENAKITPRSMGHGTSNTSACDESFGQI
jgi:hypothetical protein